MNSKPRLEAWSYSRWSLYQQCPARAKYKHIDKLPEPDGAASARGTAFHFLAEELVSGAVYAKPEARNAAEPFRKEFNEVALPNFKKDFTTLKRMKAETEAEWAFTSSWEPAGWFDRGEFAAWCRIKVDAVYRDKKRDALVIVDYKTGKIREEEHATQLTLYTLGGIIQTAYAEQLAQPKNIISELWYLDHGKKATQKMEVTQENFDELKKEWGRKTKAMLKDTRFPARPGYYCRYCPYSKAQGGPCKF